MSDTALFVIGFLIFAIAFVGSLSYTFILVTGRYDVDRLHPDDAAIVEVDDTAIGLALN
ncbi:MAG: hypothetical protein NVS3B21_32380 [Acidimicrobiales bacterium]